MKKLFGIVLLILALTGVAFAGPYDNYAPTADKVLQPDGSIVSITTSTTVAAADADRAKEYLRAPVHAAKYMLPDGSIINGIPITSAITGTATANYCIKVDGTGALFYAACATPDANVEPATDLLTATQCSGGLINNYGQAADVTLILPAAAAGLNFTVVLGTTVAKYFRLDPQAGDSIYLGGATTGDGKYVGIASAAAGAAISFVAFQTGATTYDWFAGIAAGSWVAEE